jgi:hypothetical protein
MVIRRALRVTAAITLTLQAVTTTVATISVCVDRPHAHGSVAAPDCPMHHRQSSATESRADHRDHTAAHNDGTSATTRMQCRCESDLLPSMTGESGVIADSAAVRLPNPVRLPRSPLTQPIVDVRSTPLSPPPR